MTKAWTTLLGLLSVACASSADPDNPRQRAPTSGPSGSTNGDSGATTPAVTPNDPNAPDAAPSPAGALAPGKSVLTYEAGGTSRSVVLVVPTTIRSKPVPFVIALHGNGDTAENFLKTRGFESLAETKGFVLVVPQGIVQTIAVGAQTVPNVSWDAYRDLASGNIDLALLAVIEAKLVTGNGQIDPKRVVVFGYSQGGYLGFRYGIDAAAKLSCAAVISAASPLGAAYVAQAARPIPFAMTIGDNDFGVAQARAAKNALEANGHPLQYIEIAGAGHVPFPGDPSVPLDFCLGQSLR